MDNKNLKSQNEETKSSTAKTMMTFVGVALALSAFAGYMYWSVEDAKKTVMNLKSERERLAYWQDSDCSALKRELENLVRKDLFQESYRSQQEKIKDGIFMYSQNESTTTVRQQEIISSLDAVCTKHEKRIEEIDRVLKRILTSF